MPSVFNHKRLLGLFYNNRTIFEGTHKLLIFFHKQGGKKEFHEEQEKEI